jgi:hypothetical protein
MNRHGKKKMLQSFNLEGLDRAMNEVEILEICSYLPNLREWSVVGSVSTLTVEEAREWKRICPHLEKVWFGELLSEEVKEELRGLGVELISLF